MKKLSFFLVIVGAVFLASSGGFGQEKVIDTVVEKCDLPTLDFEVYGFHLGEREVSLDSATKGCRERMPTAVISSESDDRRKSFKVFKQEVERIYFCSITNDVFSSLYFVPAAQIELQSTTTNNKVSPKIILRYVSCFETGSLILTEIEVVYKNVLYSHLLEALSEKYRRIKTPLEVEIEKKAWSSAERMFLLDHDWKKETPRKENSDIDSLRRVHASKIRANFRKNLEAHDIALFLFGKNSGMDYLLHEIMNMHAYYKGRSLRGREIDINLQDNSVQYLYSEVLYKKNEAKERMEEAMKLQRKREFDEKVKNLKEVL